MKRETETNEPDLDRALYGRVVGVVQDGQQLTDLSNALMRMGTGDMEIHRGPAGIAALEKWKDDTDQFFFGDMEGEILQRYLDAANENLIVFSVIVESSAANEVAEMCKSNGAVEVVHFGISAVTSY